VSLPFLNSRQQKPQVVDWARLIPGGTPLVRGRGKKPARAARPFAAEKVSEIVTEVGVSGPGNPLTLLLPGALQSRTARRWLRSMAGDFALVALNWLLIGALEVPLRGLFPHVRLFRFAAGAPVSLLGIALLHAALITLMVYTEGLHTGHFEQRGQADILGRSVLWATTLLCLAYRLQGAAWATTVLF
jgi:hypothetical protein